MQSDWSNLGDPIRERRDSNVVAGDDSPYYHYKAAQLALSPAVRPQRRSVLEVRCGAGYLGESSGNQGAFEDLPEWSVV
jgi:hypothetical protein